MLGCIQSNLLYESVGVWLLLSGLAGFFSMGVDKDRALRGECRVPEVKLLVIALAGGAPGTGIGSWIFHHKSSKLGFLAVLYSILVLWLFLLNQIGFLGCLSTYLPR